MKYKLTETTMDLCGHTLRRIEAVADFADVKCGEQGGWIESERNLSQDDNAWVYGNAEVCGNAEVYGNAKVYGNARVFGDARVASPHDYIVFKNWWSSGRYFTWTRSNNQWSVGCFRGTGQELIAKAYTDSKESGREYARVVKYVESILADEKGGEE